MLKMRNWHISQPDGEVVIGFEGDNLVYRLEIDSDTEPEWQMKLDVQQGKDRNIIDLERDGTMLYVDLTQDMLWMHGLYTAQIRGMNGERVAHSERFYLRVQKSVNALCGFPPCLPSEMRQIEQKMAQMLDRAEEAAERAERLSRGPRIGPAALVEDLLPGEMLFITEGDPADYEVTLEDLLAEGDKAAAGEKNRLAELLTVGRMKVLNLRASVSGDYYTDESIRDLAETIRTVCVVAQAGGVYVTEDGRTALSYRQVQYYILHGELVSYTEALQEDWPWVRSPVSQMAAVRKEIEELRAIVGDVNADLDDVLEGEEVFTEPEGGEE